MEGSQAMICQRVDLGNGDYALVCRDRRQALKKCYCRRTAVALCDYKLPSGKDCDRPLCEEHRMQQSEHIDFCLEHWAERWD